MAIAMLVDREPVMGIRSSVFGDELHRQEWTPSASSTEWIVTMLG
jgi:hypothetical protein